MAEYIIDLTKAAAELREEVVRCRDCKSMHRVRSWAGTDDDECWLHTNECWLHASPETGALGKVLTDPDGFCAWAKRRAED